MAKIGFLKDLGKQLFLRAYSDPNTRATWSFQEGSFAKEFYEPLASEKNDDESLMRIVAGQLINCYDVPSTSLLTPVLLIA